MTFSIDEIQIVNMIKKNFHYYLPCIMKNGFEIENKIDGRSVDDLDQMYKKNILPLLLQLLNTSRDYNLNSLILQLISKCFNQRVRLIKSLKNLHIIVNEKVLKKKYSYFFY